MYDQCLRGQWLRGQPGACAHTEGVREDISALRRRGVRSVRHAFWNSSTSRHAALAPDDFDFRKIEADKTRRMLLEMHRWKPDAHFYLKVRAARYVLCGGCIVAAPCICVFDFLRN